MLRHVVVPQPQREVDRIDVLERRCEEREMAARYIAAMARTDLGVRDLSDDTEGNTFVEAAHPIALEIDSHVLVADARNSRTRALADLGLERARQFVATDLDAGQCRRAAPATPRS